MAKLDFCTSYCRRPQTAVVGANNLEVRVFLELRAGAVAAGCFGVVARVGDCRADSPPVGCEEGAHTGGRQEHNRETGRETAVQPRQLGGVA